MSRLHRETNETQVSVAVGVGEGPIQVETSEPFLTHMVTTLARIEGRPVGFVARPLLGSRSARRDR